MNFYHGREERVQDWLITKLLLVNTRRQAGFSLPLSIPVLSLLGLLLSVGVISVVYSPKVFYKFIPFQPTEIEAQVPTSPIGGSFEDGALYTSIVLPPKDTSLPEGNWLVIPKIGVRTQIQEAPDGENEEAVLKEGVMRIHDSATPMDLGPVVLIAHRYGYLAWSNEFRRKNSFFNLDKLQIGDTFDVIWDQRRFTYEIYAGEESTDISDMKADVILYTCKFLKSDVRLFRYARRVEY